jgi:hypothetical protein
MYELPRTEGGKVSHWQSAERLPSPHGYQFVFAYLEPQGIMDPMAVRETNPNFMNGVPELLILRLLQQEEMYGYEIVQAIRSGCCFLG